MVADDAPGKTNYARLTAIALCVLLVWRVAATLVSPLELYADEAQYWRWGETLAWGYYSKPPMIAWVIYAATAVFGNAEWAVRLPAPFLHTAAAACLFALGREMYGARAGFFASVGYALMPAVVLSSTVLSTDGVLMPFWCLGLWCFWRLRSGSGAWISAIGLGIALGAGFLSKYAMLYFGIGIGLTLVLDADTRRAMLSLKGVLALLIGAAIFAPHMMWNAANEFMTVSHTVDNADLKNSVLNEDKITTIEFILLAKDRAGKFIGDQLGVFGPISLIALIAGLFVVRSGDKGIMGRDRWLMCFILPVLIIILGQAILNRANANWAATAYPAASILVAAWLTRAKPNLGLWFWAAGLTFAAMQFLPDVSMLTKLLVGAVLAGAILLYGWIVKQRPSGLLWTSLGLHLVVAAAFTFLSLLPAATTATLGIDNALKRTRGWEAMADEVFAKAEALNATAILVDEREHWHGLDYYGPQGKARQIPLLSWRRYGSPHSFSEFEPLTDATDNRVLVVSKHANLRARMQGDFKDFDSAGAITIPLGVRGNGCEITRHLTLYLASDYKEMPRTADWEASLNGVKLDPNPDPKCN